MSRIYHTSEIVKLAKVHPDTVRIYEEWGYLSAVEENGYRIYQEINLKQLQIARLAFVTKFFRKICGSVQLKFLSCLVKHYLRKL